MSENMNRGGKNGPVPTAGLLYPAKWGGSVFILSRLNDECDVWHEGEYTRARIGIRTVAQFWQLVK